MPLQSHIYTRCASSLFMQNIILRSCFTVVHYHIYTSILSAHNLHLDFTALWLSWYPPSRKGSCLTQSHTFCTLLPKIKPQRIKKNLNFIKILLLTLERSVQEASYKLIILSVTKYRKYPMLHSTGK